MEDEKNERSSCPTLIIDTREPKRFEVLLSQNGFKTSTDTLETGDFVIANVVIERKTVLDLLNSIYDGRLWDQLYRLMQLKDKGFIPILLLEGEIPSWDFKSHASIGKQKYLEYLNTIGTIETKCFISYGVMFKWVKTEAQFIEFMKKIFLTVRTRGKSSKPVTFKKKNRTLQEVRSDMLTAIPNIGRETADHLAKYPLDSLISMSEAELSKLKVKAREIGDAKASSLYSVFHNT